VPEVWNVAVGELLTREERMQRFGGAKYGGIETSSTTPNVFVYSDPSRGETYGYNFDGWSADRTLFLYTGEGRRGDQLMRQGNKAILEHATSGRTLRLFVANGIVAGTAKKNHLYLGEFEIDQDRPYLVEEAPDELGEDRTVFVFRLRPVSDALTRDQDASVIGEPQDTSTADLIPPEAHNAGTFQNAGAPPTMAERRESELLGRFMADLQRRGHTVRRWKLRPPGEVRPLLTDPYDETARELFEAKGTATRVAIRGAIGQLLDYRRHVPVEDLRLTVLLPHRPSDDLVALIVSCAMDCMYEDEPGDFRRA
jgi:5-methylcytosine-specific restriction protein A